MNEYVMGHGPASYEAVQETGFSHGFGRLAANRVLVEWMRRHNADPSHQVNLRFYGFDSPTEMMGADSPRQVLYVVLDYLASINRVGGQTRRDRIVSLLGADADWQNPAAAMDPTQSVGLSAAAIALRIETEDLMTELRIRRPELVARSDRDRYWEALQHASVARQLLNYHAALARNSEGRLIELLGIRDAMMADNLADIVSREHGRGNVLAFAHNAHLQRGTATMHLSPTISTWWSAGSHLDEMFGARYAVIGTAVGVSEANGIAQPEPGTLEARLTAAPGPTRFIPTHKGHGLPAAAIAALPTRSGSMKSTTYMALTPESFTDFDWLAVLDSTAYNRGGPPLQEGVANSTQ